MPKNWKNIGFIVLAIMLLTANIAFAGASIDKSELNEGIIAVKHSDSEGKKIKVMFTKGSQSITHDILKEDEFERFALNFGNGTYKVEVYKNISGTKYERVFDTIVELNITDKNLPFTKSTQEVNIENANKVLEHVTPLLEGKTSDREILEAAHNYVISSYRYDKTKINGLDAAYIPNANKIFEKKKAICYDYAAVLAVILRDSNIPTKLVKGYTENIPGVYHAWNEVYIDGKWIVVDATIDSSRYFSVLSYEIEKDSNAYKAELIY